MTIVEFLEARIAEDEKLARDAIADDNGSDEGFAKQFDSLTKPPSGIGYAKGGFGEACARIIVTMTPRRLLADINAKRAILDMHNHVEDRAWLSGAPNSWQWCTTCGFIDDAPVAWPCDTLKALAAVYADHPDYKKEWPV